MSFFANLVAETSTSTGTGNFTVASRASQGWRRASDAFGTGATAKFVYAIQHRSALEWECGVGHMLDANTLVRSEVVGSSNAGALVNFATGTKDVRCSLIAEYVSAAPVRKRRTAGNITLNSSSWANVDPTVGTTNELDIVLAARAGDMVEVGLSGFLQSESVVMYFDAASIVSAAPANYWGGAGGASDEGVGAWFAIHAAWKAQSGGAVREIVSGDLSAGTVTIRLRFRGSSASDRILRATAANPLDFWAKNHGRKAP